MAVAVRHGFTLKDRLYNGSVWLKTKKQKQQGLAVAMLQVMALVLLRC
jgi:hypothetical protein